MNASTIRRPLLVLSTALLLTGARAACGSSVRARTGYIPRSVQMTELNDMTQEWRGGARIADFTSVTVAEVATPNTGAYGDISDEKLAEVRTALQKALSEELAQLKPSGAGGRTLVVRAAVTAIKPNNPLLNVAPQTQILKRGYGYASCEIYATDGEVSRGRSVHADLRHAAPEHREVLRHGHRRARLEGLGQGVPRAHRALNKRVVGAIPCGHAP